MIIILSVLILITYWICLKFWKENTYRFSEKTSRLIKYIHYLFLSISIILFANGLNLKGIWTSRIVFLTSLFLGIFFNLIAQKIVLTKIEKMYFNFLSVFPIVIFSLILIPFLGIVLIASIIGQLFNPYETIYYNDDHIRIQSSFMGVLSAPKVKMYTKDAFFERLVESTERFPEDIDSLKVTYTNDSIKVVMWYQYNENPEIPQIISVKR